MSDTIRITCDTTRDAASGYPDSTRPAVAATGRDGGPVRLGLFLGYQAARTTPADQLALAQAAEELGYDSVWVAEAYGSDAPSMLAWIAGQTRRIDLGSAIMQIPGRSPAMTAMTAATIDMLSGGRFRLGLGVSGPQVSEGWHGVRFDAPLARTREYVEIVRLALARKPVAYDGQHYRLPLPNGPGKALRLTVHPVREHIPIYLAAVGPKNIELAGEIADGWLAIFFTPEYASEQRAALAAGRARSGRALVDFDIVPTVPAVLGDDIAACGDLVRAYAALYVGGMGSREKNFYNAHATRMGFGDAAREIQDLYLAKRHREAAAAVPLEFLDRTALLGPVDRVADRLHEYAAAGVRTLAVSVFAADVDGGIRQLRLMAQALERSGLAP
jgi:F420-dependent oxidoreductase-like protein